MQGRGKGQFSFLNCLSRNNSGGRKYRRRPIRDLPDESDEPKPRLLLVDDHPDTLRLLAALLRKAGYAVETAASVREAEPLLAHAEVLISDIGLPDGNGCDLMQRFQGSGGIQGIAITGFGQEEDIVRSECAGFTKHLTKPVDVEVLKAALREIWQPRAAADRSASTVNVL